ncbi:MAG: rhodanese-like domain-containing protein [bacterium]|nr:rhodanese-like domain-containing protein [bacterium]MCP5067511.1 rhodanese-like domain-containing protein [bacterium]
MRLLTSCGEDLPLVRSPGNRGAVAVLSACLLVSIGCADHLARTELWEQIQAGGAPQIVDVRSQGEYEASHVPGAIHLPFYSLLGAADEIDEASDDLSRPVVVYCEHGPRARIARALLWLASDRQVLFLEGHMGSWKQEGLPVETDPAPGSNRIEQDLN